ncbi:TolC family protein [Sulfurimonas sp. HSL3-7]|uniref:TolC family protein n=1 Tax=Sulfonitrofixus jiaomeiensis TaxID=3131938 RepID=UPI0031F9F8B8
MKILVLLLLSLAGLSAGSMPLASYLTAVESSNAIGAFNAQSAAEAALQRSQVQSEGFLLNGELGYAAEKQSDRDALEYHLSVEKRLFFGNSGAYADALRLSSETQQTLQLNRLRTVVYEHYVNACALQEKAGLLKDAQDRNIELTKLIDEGVKGGEFDRSALLRSELIVDELQLRIRDLESRYYEALQTLQLYTQTDEEPLCQDLPFAVTLQDDLEADSLLYRYLESEITASSALKAFHATAIKEVSVGVGYDNEMDLSRGIVFMQIPLTQGSRRESEREAAAQSKLAAQQQLLFAKAEMQAQIRSYKTAQQTRQKAYQRLNDILIPTAYETSVLLLERFMGSEGSYLAYIDSQKTLFDLLIRGIDTRADTLLAQAKLYRTLGIDPQKDIK